MKGFLKAFVTAGLCMCMALSVTACGKKALDGKQVVATVGEKEMALGEVNFLLRFQQSQTEAMYESMVGEGIYDKDLLGNGTTFGETMKENVMSTMYDYYVLREKAADYGVEVTDADKEKITAAAEAFLGANETYTKEQMTADQETVETVLTLMTYGTRMEEAILAEADITIGEDEAETEEERATLQRQKEAEYYNEVVGAWREEYPLEIKEDVWSQVVFDRSYDIVTEDK